MLTETESVMKFHLLPGVVTTTTVVVVVVVALYGTGVIRGIF